MLKDLLRLSSAVLQKAMQHFLALCPTMTAPDAGEGVSAGVTGQITLTEKLMAGLQTGGAGYYNRCPGMQWSSNLFRNNSANSGGAGLELNECSGDVDHCSFHQNQVCADANISFNTFFVCVNLPGGRWCWKDVASGELP